MKNQNYLMTGLAIVGAISLIIMACSAEESNSSNNNNSASGIGKYQITNNPNSNQGSFHIIDTETGVVKTFEKSTSNGNFTLTRTTITQ
jgi:uncharacterized protein involved in high-affinity Fe2+ transport